MTVFEERLAAARDRAGESELVASGRRMNFGLPYAHAVMDAQGYGVKCPACGLVCRGVDEGQETGEDALTKGASRVYAEHYTEEHEAPVRRRRHR